MKQQPAVTWGPWSEKGFRVGIVYDPDTRKASLYAQTRYPYGSPVFRLTRAQAAVMAPWTADARHHQ